MQTHQRQCKGRQRGHAGNKSTKAPSSICVECENDNIIIVDTCFVFHHPTKASGGRKIRWRGDTNAAAPPPARAALRPLFPRLNERSHLEDGP
jgi:hypothetical protein